MDNETKVKTIIGTAASSAVGAALIPVPIADVIMISGVQIGMLVSISAVYGSPITKDTAKGLLLTYGTANMGMWMASLLKGIPGIGTAAGIAICATIAGTLTLTLGLAFNAMVRSGKPINAKNLKNEARKAKSEATKLAEDFKARAKRTQDVKDSVAFRAQPNKFVDRVEFYFNPNVGGGKKSIRVTELNGSDLVWQAEVVDNRQPVVWESNNLAGGIYIAYLDIEGLIPIPIKLSK